MPEEATAIENERLLEFNQSRMDAAEKTGGTRAEAAPRVEMLEALLMVGFALINDIADLLVIGSIPILGDIIDAITWYVIYEWARTRGLKNPLFLKTAGVVEFIPFGAGDILPIYTLMVLAIILYNNNRWVRDIMGNQA
ncbi:MAG: hypothetical protein HY446_00180 [Candidatus Niyogibacteria bacterium]|nr:hypothetical protein [Candidatus Niyogibacteria bacterium]